MRRILWVLSVALVMAAMVVVTAVPAFAKVNVHENPAGMTGGGASAPGEGGGFGGGGQRVAVGEDGSFSNSGGGGCSPNIGDSCRGGGAVFRDGTTGEFSVQGKGVSPSGTGGRCTHNPVEPLDCTPQND